MQQQQINAGETIIREGDPSDAAYFILDGNVDIFRDNDGRSVLLGTLMPGQFFGEMGVIRDTCRSATVRAACDLKVARIEKQDFLSVFGGKDNLAWALLRMLSERLTDADRRISEMELRSTGAKVDRVKLIRLLPNLRSLVTQIGADGVVVEKLPFRVGRRAIRREPQSITQAHLSLRSEGLSEVSFEHFAIEDHGGEAVVRDLDSHLGTLVNGERIASFAQNQISGLQFGINDVQVGGTDSSAKFRIEVSQ